MVTPHKVGSTALLGTHWGWPSILWSQKVSVWNFHVGRELWFTPLTQA